MKKRNVLVILLSLILLLCSCGENETQSDVKDALTQSSQDLFSSSETSVDLSSKEETDISEQKDTSEEISMAIDSDDPKTKLTALLKNTFDINSFYYNFSLSLTNEDKTASINSCFFKEQSFCYSLSTIKNGDNTVSQFEDYYFNNQIFFNDDILKKSKYECDQKDFFDYISKKGYYYSPFECSKETIINDEENIEYSITSDIFDKEFIKVLSSLLKTDNLEFETGRCIFSISESKENIQKITGEIYTNTSNSSINSPANISFEITFEKISDFKTPANTDEYKNFFSKEGFFLSKGMYQLVQTNSYEISNETRAYKVTGEKELCYDLNTDFAFNFTNNVPSLSCLVSLLGTDLYNAEKYFNGKEYFRSYQSGEKVPSYTIKELNPNFSNVDTLNFWSPLIFDISQTLNYTLSETEGFYIIDYTYNSDSAIKLLESQNKLWKTYFPTFNYIPAKEIKDLNSASVNKATGSIIIRKKDGIIIEHSFNISITTKSNINFRIISQTEVLALYNDVAVIKPSK